MDHTNHVNVCPSLSKSSLYGSGNSVSGGGSGCDPLLPVVTVVKVTNSSTFSCSFTRPSTT
ncbi:hypothetical protein DPMN_166769 [Dreissena polymorpha]|uniref:Uncharacterized protein n=1 Tax=Dreissena polymorpha TaxID=45954 RepID=A0A9D4F062_DREPO|nr:hypothetical protein DPMN_166769 [Dreissena polymorpha]